MSSCLIKKFLPFALAFLCGVAAWQLVGVKLRALNDILYLEHGRALLPAERGGTWTSACREDEGSRTWLVVREKAAPAAKSSGPQCDGCSVRMRVLFGVDGAAVPGTGFSLTPSSYPILEDAVRAARDIAFRPATKNGKQIPVWANVTYACGETRAPDDSGPRPRGCGLSVDKDSARTWDGRPWRVTTTHE